MNADRNDHQLPNASAKHAHPLIRSLFKFLGLVLLYLLSTGPAAWLETNAPFMHPILATLYSPIQALCMLCPPAGYALLWYLGAVWKIPIEL